ncbi:class A beta-lactamase [Ruegeria sp. A3M17]|uniref:class A beta-lactamase n=1 Tax=Ruegeria sp. A3M17 TaxID=2267229 RepID=UPI000DE951A7|nr:class A beta-lactamase [Ruegeria sp. A3M17]
MRGLRKIATILLFLITIAVGLATSAQAQTLTETVQRWERRLDARIGLLLYDPSNEWEVSYRADELFPMSSTFKPLLCGAVLAEVDAGTESLSDHVTYQSTDLVDYSPVTSKHVETGMTVGALCEATMTISDNAAANLLLRHLDGPAGLTEFLRTNGDDITRLDRWETALNEATPGDPRDTTTPRAILATLDRLLFGRALSPASSTQLRQWMIDDQVADGLIRAQVPDGWTIGDKTGAGGHGSRAIVAFLQTPGPRTYLAAIYLTESDAPLPERNAVLSDIGRAMIAEIAARPD